jgi:hypothetical protein
MLIKLSRELSEKSREVNLLQLDQILRRNTAAEGQDSIRQNVELTYRSHHRSDSVSTQSLSTCLDRGSYRNHFARQP